MTDTTAVRLRDLPARHAGLFNILDLRALVIGLFLAMGSALTAQAGEYFLTIDEVEMVVDGETRTGLGNNGSIPGPILRFREGEEVTIHVTNNLDEDSSIHWHGILLPNSQDGVPGLTFDGIPPGETFTYNYTLMQHGTYWYHSHSGHQEQRGVFGALIVEPAEPDAVEYDREHVVVLSDWLHENPATALRNLKGRADYYNFNRRTVGDFFRDLFTARTGSERQAVIQGRLDWGAMRMDPTDIADVSGYTFLMNGQEPGANWSALFEPGERVRLRFINAAAMTYFDVRIPGLSMTVVNADGNNVVPVSVDEIRVAVAETYDVIVEPQDHQAYTIFAQARSREGYARGTLTPQMGMEAPIPEMSEREVLTMAAMGHMPGMDMDGMDMGGMEMDGMEMDHAAMGHGQPVEAEPDPMSGMDHAAMGHGQPVEAEPDPMSGTDHAAMGHGQLVEAEPDPMSGMDHAAMGHGMPAPPDPHAGHDMGAPESDAPMSGRITRLSYDDLEALDAYDGARPPDRTIVLRLTGVMERYIWTINDVRFQDSEPIQMRMGERVRLEFVNETMMDHPMHLHGMWMDLQNGHGDTNPRKHTISIPPGQTLYADVTVDALGEWAFHCHLMFHMASGMFQRVIVAEAVES